MWDKRTLAVIIDNYKIVCGNLEISFLSWAMFNKVFPRKKMDAIMFNLVDILIL